MLRGTSTLHTQREQLSFRRFHLFDRDAHSIHVVFPLFKQRYGRYLPRVLPCYHDIFYVLMLVVRLLLQQVQALQLIRSSQEKPQRMQLLNNHLSSCPIRFQE
jgi:hypothetical protein